VPGFASTPCARPRPACAAPRGCRSARCVSVAAAAECGELAARAPRVFRLMCAEWMVCMRAGVQSGWCACAQACCATRSLTLYIVVSAARDMLCTPRGTSCIRAGHPVMATTLFSHALHSIAQMHDTVVGVVTSPVSLTLSLSRARALSLSLSTFLVLTSLSCLVGSLCTLLVVLHCVWIHSPPGYNSSIYWRIICFCFCLIARN
jgi:hypothetical protein